MIFQSKFLGVLFLVVLASGCGNPVTSVVTHGVQIVGDVVNDAETKKLGEELNGQTASAADARLGQTIDVYTDQNTNRQWRVYQTPADLLDNQRYVVIVANDRIIDVEMVKITPDKIDIAKELIYAEKLKGKTPPECTAALNLGPPLFVMRSRNTGQLFQLYDARLIKEFTKPHYCVVRFDIGGRCDKVKFVEVTANAQ